MNQKKRLPKHAEQGLTIDSGKPPSFFKGGFLSFKIAISLGFNLLCIVYDLHLTTLKSRYIYPD